MSVMEFGPEGAATLVATLIGTAAMAGITSWLLFDMTLSDVAFQLVGNGVTLATLLTLDTLGVTILTNDSAELSTLHQQTRDLDNYYYYSIITSVGLLVGWILFGGVSSFAQSQDLWDVGYVAVSLTAQTAIGWML